MVVKIMIQKIERKKDKKVFLFFFMNDIIVMIGKIGGNMNRKGQALVEFVLILPVFLFILFVIIDFGVIFSTMNNLESDSSDIISLYKNGTTIEELKKMYSDNRINIYDDGKYYKFDITTSINLITPGFNRLFGDPYVIKIERTVPYA